MPSIYSPLPSTSAGSATIKLMFVKADTLKAEVWWCVRSALKNHSFNSNSDIGLYLKQMFPDVPAVSSFTLSETKSIYLTVHGGAPLLKSILLKDVKKEPYCLLFDESLNKSLMSKQLDIHIRYWSNATLQTRYLDSFMLGHPTALH